MLGFQFSVIGFQLDFLRKAEMVKEDNRCEGRCRVNSGHQKKKPRYWRRLQYHDTLDRYRCKESCNSLPEAEREIIKIPC